MRMRNTEKNKSWSVQPVFKDPHHSLWYLGVESEVNVAVYAVAVGLNLLGESRLADGSAANIN